MWASIHVEVVANWVPVHLMPVAHPLYRLQQRDDSGISRKDAEAHRNSLAALQLNIRD
jgi:hypothetical protein